MPLLMVTGPLTNSYTSAETGRAMQAVAAAGAAEEEGAAAAEVAHEDAEVESEDEPEEEPVFVERFAL